MKMIKDNLAGEELRISSDAIDIVVDCCSGRSLVLAACLCKCSTIEPCRIVLGRFLRGKRPDCVCGAEFVKMLYTQANEVCTEDKKNTIVPDHVLKAVEQLELPDWIEPLQKALVEYKELNKPVKSTKAAATMNDEQLVRFYHRFPGSFWCLSKSIQRVKCAFVVSGFVCLWQVTGCMFAG